MCKLELAVGLCKRRERTAARLPSLEYTHQPWSSPREEGLRSKYHALAFALQVFEALISNVTGYEVFRMLETLLANIIDETQDFRFHFFRCDCRLARGPLLSTCVNRMHTVLSLSRSLPCSVARHLILTWQFDHHSGILSVNLCTLLAHSWETPTCSLTHFLVAEFHSGTPTWTRILGACAPAPCVGNRDCSPVVCCHSSLFPRWTILRSWHTDCPGLPSTGFPRFEYDHPPCLVSPTPPLVHMDFLSLLSTCPKEQRKAALA